MEDVKITLSKEAAIDSSPDQSDIEPDEIKPEQEKAKGYLRHFVGKIKVFIFNYQKKIVGRYQIILLRLRNRIPESFFYFTRKYLAPYLAIVTIALFSFVADYAKAAENSYYYQPSDEVMDLSPAEVADVASAVAPYTNLVEVDPVTVALAVDNSEFLGKPVLADTQITEIQPSEQKRTKTITYTVDEGDTISSIGWKYGLKIATIKSANSLSGDTIKPGQQLKIPPQDLDPKALANLQKKKVAGITIPFSGKFGRPTRGWLLSQGFGRTSFERWHTGIDLDSRSGTAILASASGRVVSVSRGWGGGYGNHIIIDHGSGFTTLYGHLSSFSVSSGQLVNQGQQIGIMGSTGWSTGVHLHFEIRVKGSPQNPMNYL